MVTQDDYKYAYVRKLILDSVREDLIGPGEEKETITDFPSSKYITGILYPSDSLPADADEDFDFEDNSQGNYENENVDEYEEEEEKEKTTTGYQKPTSIGLSFYISKSIRKIKATISWGSYDEIPKESEEDKGHTYIRTPHLEEIEIPFLGTAFNSEIKLHTNNNIRIVTLCRKAKNDNLMVTVFLNNNDAAGEKEAEWRKSMYQVEMKIESVDSEEIFIPEYECRENLGDEFYYQGRPVFARGRQCAAVWDYRTPHKAVNWIKTDFIPEYEIPAIDYVIKELPPDALSMSMMCNKKRRDETIQNLRKMTSLYSSWIDTKLASSSRMKQPEFVSKGNEIIQKCKYALERMNKGIGLLESDEKVLQAFLFMNQVMYMQQAITDHCRHYDSETRHKLEDSLSAIQQKSAWRPFQIAFILLNLYGIVNGESEEREIVDLLFFPTGGGKTEAYLGLMAFTIAYRRLTTSEENEYEKDGGVTVLLRYTLRLLTMQQRDRILKLVIAMEMQRAKHPDIWGNERISIGFWVGGGVTPNKFSEYNETNHWEKAQFENKIFKQIIKCPFCGKELEKSDFTIIKKAKTVQINCSNPDCCFHKSNDTTMPVYVVDEEIYAKCPTIVISTVDKFARLPWTEETGLLFGKTNKHCERCGYIAIGSDRHPEKTHESDRYFKLPRAQVNECKPFYPPELIIQDELHLITGSLGTIYGGFETVVEDMCCIDKNGKKIRPKYIVSTATIKNAEYQIKSLYGRNKYCQFPPSGFDVRDSYFINEIPLPTDYPSGNESEKIQTHINNGEKPFRMYASVCAPGFSMKIAMIRLYAVLLNKSNELLQDEEYKDYIDPYYTLVGYFNSLRELGSTVRLLSDEIPSHLLYLKNLYKQEKQRFLNNTKEITSRIPSGQIAEILENLAIRFDSKEAKAYDAVIATNMIAVGMDVDRLGLMCVAGQQKQNSEFIQATSRVGRKYPGLIFTLDNPYKARDLSVYENFTGFHSQMVRYVEGNSVTPFSARARDRVLHSVIISLIRLQIERLASNKNAVGILDITDEEINKIKETILNRIEKVEPDACSGTETEIDSIIAFWKEQAKDGILSYTIPFLPADQKRLMAVYGDDHVNEGELETLNSMRDVEATSTMFLWQEDKEDVE